MIVPCGYRSWVQFGAECAVAAGRVSSKGGASILHEGALSNRPLVDEIETGGNHSAVEATRAPYNYADDDPLTLGDPSGMSAGILEELPCPWCVPPLPPAIQKIIAAGIQEGADAIGKYVTSNASEDEGEAELQRRENEERSCAAERIANGHAFGKHAGEFGAGTREDFEEVIKDVIDHATKSKELSKGRTAYYDEKTNTVVIVDPSSPDGGTVFKPSNGKSYFNGLH